MRGCRAGRYSPIVLLMGDEWYAASGTHLLVLSEFAKLDIQTIVIAERQQLITQIHQIIFDMLIRRMYEL